MSIREIIDETYKEVKAMHDEGKLASYIPELANVDPDKFGVYISTVDGYGYGRGDDDTYFSIQSIVKVISLTMVYEKMGENIWERIGVEPAGTPFNSLVQLETDFGIPRNPFINSGALVICDMLLSNFKNANEELLAFTRFISDIPTLNYSQKIANSEKSVGYRNTALCNFIKSFGNIMNEPSDVLELYFMMCSMEMNCNELSKTFLFLANGGSKLSEKQKILSESQSKRINALMQTCGFYDESGEFTFKVGLPGKSGVGGGVVAILPNKYSIGVWSPKLNKKGNSVKGMKFLELFTTKTRLSIF